MIQRQLSVCSCWLLEVRRTCHGSDEFVANRMTIIILTEMTLISLSCSTSCAVLIIPRTNTVKPGNLNPTIDLNNTSQLRGVHWCGATVPAFSSIEWLFFSVALGSLMPDPCFLLQLPSLLRWGSSQLHAKDSSCEKLSEALGNEK